MPSLSRWLTLIAVVGLAACRGTSTPTPTALASPTPPDIPPTASHTPTIPPTAAPTSTPDPPFSQTGPWLVFREWVGDVPPDYLWAINADGTALRQLSTDAVWHFDIRPRRDEAGQAEVAYITSSDAEGQTDLTLNLLTLPDGATRRITRLTSDETGWKLGDHVSSSDELRSEVSAGLTEGNNLKWSPDGRWLAFPAALDGPSIDVYSYEAATGIVRRLTSGSNHAVRFRWTPDSHLIVHTATECFWCSGDYTHGIWAARPDGSGVIQLESPAEKLHSNILEQIEPGVFLAGSIQQGTIDWLRLLNIATGQTQMLVSAPNGVSSLTVGAEAHIALFHVRSVGDTDAFARTGWYMIDAARKAVYVTDGDEGLVVWNAGSRVFIARSYDSAEFAISADGRVVDIPPYLSYPSPDGSISVLTSSLDDGPPGIWIRRDGGEPVRVAENGSRWNRVRWSADSQHFLLNFSSPLRVASAPDFVPVVVSPDISGLYSAWTP